MKIPTFDEFMFPVIKSLRNLGGSGSNDEIYDEVVKLGKFDDRVLNVLHNPEKSSQTEIEYRLGWSRTYLKKAGYLENSSRGIWSLTDKAKQSKKINTNEIVKYVRSLESKKIKTNKKNKPTKKSKTGNQDNKVVFVSDEISEESRVWREHLHHVLIKQITPDAFERLAKRLLRESGFKNVEVTGKTGDGGIDGRGVARINGLISIHVVFQCKKYKGSVGSPEIRDFRGAMTGRVDKGLFITTGSFTKAAVAEANREGAPPIDLIDGDLLADKLKEFSLGIKKEMVEVEKVTVDTNWFLNL